MVEAWWDDSEQDSLLEVRKDLKTVSGSHKSVT
jgi:hypothetical protein